MVKINKETHDFTVTIKGDKSTVTEMQKALIDLLKHYDYEGFGNGSSGTMYYSHELLNSLIIE